MTTNLPRGRHRKQSTPFRDWVTLIKMITALVTATGQVISSL